MVDDEKAEQPVIQKDEKSDDAKLVEENRKRLKQIALRLFRQLKFGCKKALCMNENCHSNLYARTKFVCLKTDAEILAHAMRLIKGGQADTDKLLCSDITSVQADNLDTFNETQLSEVFEDFY